MNSKKIDMTTGPIMKNVFLFALPIVLGTILQQLYTTVDTLVIGNIGYHMSAGILRGMGDSKASLWFFAVFNGIMCIVNGVGLIKYTTMVNLLMLWAVRIPSAFLIDRFFDGTYMMLCFPISFFFGMIMMILYYIFSKSWKKVLYSDLETKEAA